MFRHPIRDLILLSAVSWYAKRTINRHGGTSKLWSAMRKTSRPAGRQRSRSV